LNARASGSFRNLRSLVYRSIGLREPDSAELIMRLITKRPEVALVFCDILRSQSGTRLGFSPRARQHVAGDPSDQPPSMGHLTTCSGCNRCRWPPCCTLHPAVHLARTRRAGDMEPVQSITMRAVRARIGRLRCPGHYGWHWLCGGTRCIWMRLSPKNMTEALTRLHLDRSLRAGGALGLASSSDVEAIDCGCALLSRAFVGATLF
jgi:hypothetical protein